MFSAEQISSVYAHSRVSKQRELERCEKETRVQKKSVFKCMKLYLLSGKR